MEGHLRGAHHGHAAKGVGVGKGAERLHHGLLRGLRAVGALDHHVGGGKGGIQVAVDALAVRHEVARGVAGLVAAGRPVVLVVDDGGVVERLLHVDDGGQLLVGDLHGLHARGGRGLGLGHDHGHLVAHVAHVPIEKDGVVGARLGEGLAGKREAVVRHVVRVKDRDDAGNLERAALVDVRDDGVGVAAAHELHHEGALGREVGGVDGRAGQKRPGVLLRHGARDLGVLLTRLGGGVRGHLARRQLAAVCVAGEEAADGAHLARVAGAAAEVAGEVAAHGLVVGARVGGVEREHGHLEARRAEAALLGALLGEALGKKLAAAVAHALEGGHLAAVGARHHDGAREHRLAVQKNGAQAAVARLAGALDGLEAVSAAEVKEGHVGADVLGEGRAVEGEGDLHGTYASFSARGLAAAAATARRMSAGATWRRHAAVPRRSEP